jgi:ubiquinone/menaquinone biosynthesis C-methylase UbiE
MKGFSMGDHAAGSYAFGTFDENQDELARLKQQAAIVSEMEGRVLQEVGLKPGMRALDLACGPGIVTALLAEMVTPADVIGVDLSEDLLHEAHTYLEKSWYTQRNVSTRRCLFT